MANPDRISAVHADCADALRIELSSGKCYRVSLADPMAALEGFEGLRDPVMFATAQVADWGWAVEWDCGLSMSSVRLDQMGKEQAGDAYPVAAFRAWIKRNGMSLSSTAEALGLSRRAVSQYSSGARPIPKVVGLALRGLERTQRRQLGKTSPVGSTSAS